MKNHISSSFLLGFIVSNCFSLGTIILSEGLKGIGWIRDSGFTGNSWTGLFICIPFFVFSIIGTKWEWKA